MGEKGVKAFFQDSHRPDRKSPRLLPLDHMESNYQKSAYTKIVVRLETIPGS